MSDKNIPQFELVSCPIFNAKTLKIEAYWDPTRKGWVIKKDITPERKMSLKETLPKTDKVFEEE